MEEVKDTPLEHGVIVWPIRPPRTSMIVVVKATFALGDGTARLAERQDLVTGALHWDDDPLRPTRVPSDFALLKPRGECFVVGSCRTLTERPVDQTVFGFRVGEVSRTLRVYGDRTWANGSPSRAVPFSEMPLTWERSFGGPGYPSNPVGRGLAEGADGIRWLPNFEDPDRPITAHGDRPPPAGAFPVGMMWPARARYLGTYDASWQKTRAPWLAADFQFAFFNEAPPEQQIEGYWRGDERIELRHLHPALPAVRASLPAIRARAFVERGGAFDEVPLVLDTITIDADRGLALAVWRGAVDLAHDRYAPDGIDRLFVMHEDAEAPSSLAACRDRMRAKRAADQAAIDSMAGAPPPAPEAPVRPEPPVNAREHVRTVETPREDAGAAALEKLEHDLTNAGIDVKKLLAEAEGKELAMPEPADTAKLLEAIERSPLPVPPELVRELLNPRPQEEVEEDFEEPGAPEPVRDTDLRQLVIDLHRQRRPVRGDFSGVNLAGLDLRGLDACDALLLDVNLRGANLSGAKLDGATLVRADLLSAILSKASLRDADLTDAVLEDARFDGANLAGATLARAELQQAVLDGTRLEKADLTGAILEEASLVGARCDGATFNGATLTGASFEGARLVSARFYGVSAERISLDRAELEGLRVGRGANLSGSTVRDASAKGSHFRDSTLEGVVFTKTVLSGADFSRSRMAGANLRACDAQKARFLECHLVGARMEGANLYQATFREADLQGANLRGANLYQADFYRARGEGVDLSGALTDGASGPS